MNDIEPTRPAQETRNGGLLGLLRELGCAYIGALGMAAEGAGSLYRQCVVHGEQTVAEMQAALDERRRDLRRSRRQRTAQQNADLAAHTGRQVQAWLGRGTVSKAEVARLTEQIDELSRQLEALHKEDGQL